MSVIVRDSTTGQVIRNSIAATAAGIAYEVYRNRDAIPGFNIVGQVVKDAAAAGARKLREHYRNRIRARPKRYELNKAPVRRSVRIAKNNRPPSPPPDRMEVDNGRNDRPNVFLRR